MAGQHGVLVSTVFKVEHVQIRHLRVGVQLVSVLPLRLVDVSMVLCPLLVTVQPSAALELKLQLVSERPPVGVLRAVLCVLMPVVAIVAVLVGGTVIGASAITPSCLL